MRKETIEGIGSFQGGIYDEVTIDGIGKLKGDMKAKSIRVDGLFKGKGRITADTFSCDGIARMFKNIKVRNLEIDGLFKVRRAKVEAENIHCDGIIVSSGEVSADIVNIEGVCSISELYGDRIRIKYDLKNTGKGNISGPFRSLINYYFGRPVSTRYSLVDTIECTDLEADKLHAKTIKARNVTLGPDCIVGYLECDGELKVHPSCKIARSNRDIKTTPYQAESYSSQSTDTSDDNTSIEKIIKNADIDTEDPRVNEVKIMLDVLSQGKNNRAADL